MHLDPCHTPDFLLLSLLVAIDAATHHTVEIEIAPILRFIFQDRKVDAHTRITNLSEAEQAILRRIYENERIWDPRSGTNALVFREIGLENSRSQWGALLGKA